MRRSRTPLLFCVSAAIALFACAHAEIGQEPSEELNSPRCVTDVECGHEQRCVKEENRPDGICAVLDTKAESAGASHEPPAAKSCKTAKDCPGKPCTKKRLKEGDACAVCDSTHVCRSIVIPK